MKLTSKLFIAPNRDAIIKSRFALIIRSVNLQTCQKISGVSITIFISSRVKAKRSQAKNYPFIRNIIRSLIIKLKLFLQHSLFQAIP
jgi:hypothetical protein